MNTLKYTPPIRHSHLALCLLFSVGAAHAGIGETPFSLTLSQAFMHDSNIEKTEGGRSDNLAISSVALSLDKDYGRQSYSAALQGIIQRYQDLTIYNNNGFEASLRASSEVGRSSSVELVHRSSQKLQPFEFQGNGQRVKQTLTDNATNINAYHGLYGRWKLIGNLAFTNIDYDRSRAESRDSRGVRVGVRYSPTDLLYFESGLRRTQTDYDALQVFTGPTSFYIGDRVKRTDLDFQSSWVITGLSNLYGQINWTDEKHESLATGQPGDPARDYQGVTGSLTWNYTPRGKLSYSLRFSRDTNNSGGFSSRTTTTTQDRLNTSLNLNAKWQMTHKIAVRTGVGLQRIEEDEQQRFAGGAPLTESSSGTRQEVFLSADYDLSRSWSFSCALSNTDRDRTIFNSGYQSRSVTCSGNFLMD